MFMLLNENVNEKCSQVLILFFVLKRNCKIPYDSYDLLVLVRFLFNLQLSFAKVNDFTRKVKSIS